MYLHTSDFILNYWYLPSGLVTFCFVIYSYVSPLLVRSRQKSEKLRYTPGYHWEQIIRSINEGLLIVDNAGRIVYANEAFCKLTGYTFAEMEGKVAHELLIDERERTNFESRIENRKNREYSQYEVELKTRLGNKLWVLVNGAPYIDHTGNVIGSIGTHTDISRLKQTEKKLISKENKLNNAQAVAHIGSWELNFSTNTSLWSDEACRIYKLPLTENVNSYETWISFIHPEDLARVNMEVEKARSTLAGSSFAYRIVCRDGSVKHIRSVSKFEFNELSYPVGLNGTCHDITEEKEIEQALSESEQMIKTFVSESLLSVYFVDPRTKKIIYANPSFLDLLGYTEERIKSVTVHDFVDETPEAVDRRITEVIEKKITGSRVRQWKRNDGRIIQVLVSSFCMTRNGVEIIYAAAQDITESVEARVQAEFAQRNLDALINSTTDLMWSVDTNARLITANNAFIEIIRTLTGKKIAVGDNVFMKENFSPEISEKWEALYQRVFSGESFTVEEYTAEPEESWGEISLHPIMEGAKVIGASCFSRNITQSKSAEQQRDRITNDLIQRNKVLEQFAYIVSHNLRAPVANILGLSNVVQTPNLSLENLQECLRGFVTSARTLDDTLIDLNSILQIGRELNEKKEVADFSNMVSNITDSIRQLVEKENVVIKTDFSQMGEMNTIKSYLYSIFYNLILNSIKYRRADETPVIEITSSKKCRKSILSFKDNGIGIDLALHGNKVFGLYKRFHLDVEGKGIGLYMVKTQVETLGGKISLKSRVNSGTEFVLEFEE